MSIISPPMLRPTAASTSSKSSPRPSVLPRRSTLKRSIDDSSPTNAPSSPIKRPRVKFDADVDIVSADEEDDIDPAVVHEQVRRAIERHLAFDHEAYEKLRSYFTADPEKGWAPSSRFLRLHVQALEANVTKLRKQCGSLVQSVIASEWVGRDDNYVTSLTRFLGSLVVTQGGFTTTIIGMLVDLLGPQQTRRVPQSKVVRQPKIHKRALEALRYLTQLNPIISSVVAQKISAKLEFDFQKGKDRMTFVESFMLLIEYVPELSSEVLTSILQQLIKLDAGIQADLEDDDAATEDLLNHMTNSQMLVYQQKRRLSQTSTDDDSNSSVSDASDSDEDDDLDEAGVRRKQLKEAIGQVDMMMNILFEHYSKIMGQGSQKQDNAIEHLISQFNQYVLPAHRSRHPQFLVFHFAQTTKARVDRFITNCLSRLFDQRFPPFIRHQAAAYFSGFVGRAANVTPALVQECLDILCMEMDRLRLRYELGCTQPDLRRYNDFYVMFQAVMYIFCFRWKDLSTNTIHEDEYSDAEDADEEVPYTLPRTIQDAIHAAIYSPLNPLRICTPNIVAQFAEITHSLQVFYIYPKIEENKRVRIITARSGDTSSNGPETFGIGDNGTLEAYYPYDPYHLPISSKWVADHYLEWQGAPGDEDDEDEDSEDDDDEEEEDFDMVHGVDGDGSDSDVA